MSYQDYCNGYDRRPRGQTNDDYIDYMLGNKHYSDGWVKWTESEFKAGGSSVAGVNHKHPEAASGAQREKLSVLPYDLIPFQEITDAYARVAEHGAKKYAPWNWSKGLARVQLCGSLLRHTFAYLRGEECDPDSGLLHTDHILWNAAALSHNVHHNLEDGRRPEPPREYKGSSK